jgi:uncharacterized protein (UPF0276 family)
VEVTGVGAADAEVAAGEAAVVVGADAGDRFGIGWRDRLAAGIFTHLDEIDAVEVIAENCMDASTRRLRSLRALGREVPLLVHGVGLGAASVSPVDRGHLDRLARVVGALEPRAWSEHLSFVRSGGYEIGHLAAPPRSAATIEGAARNLRKLRDVVGARPAIENIATLMAPPGCSMDEPCWVKAITTAAETPLLLDLHNLYANAVNFGHDPFAYLRRFPLDAVEVVHISGGIWMECDGSATDQSYRRLLDDHLHDVPDPVFFMLEVLGEVCPQSLTVILERDGRFPSMVVLLQQLRRARAAVAEGRRRRLAGWSTHELDAA